MSRTRRTPTTVLAGIALALVLGCSRQAPEPEIDEAEASPPARTPVPPPADSPLRGHQGPTICVAFSPDGKRMASGSADRTVKIWDVASGQHQRTLGGSDDYINWVTFSPDGQRLAAVSERYGEPGTVKIWDAATGQEVASLRGHAGLLSRLAFSPDSARLASASADRTVKVWDLAAGKEVLTLRDHVGPVHAVAYRPDGRRIATASFASVVIGKTTGEVKLWDAATGKELLTIKVPGQPVSVSFSPDGQRLAVASGEESRIWDATTGKEVLVLKGTGYVVQASYRGDGKQLAGVARVWNAAGRQDVSAVRFWDAATGNEERTVSAATAMVTYSADGRRLASAGSDVQVWDVAAGKPILTLTGPNPADFPRPRPIQLLGLDARRLASLVRIAKVPGGDLHIRDVATDRKLVALRHDDAWIFGVAFSPDGSRIATAAGDDIKGELKLWDGTTGQELKQVRSVTGEVQHVAFSPDGKHLLAVHLLRGESTGTLHDPATLKEVQVLSRKGMGSLLYHPDGRLLEWAGEKIKEALTGKDVLTLRSRGPFGFAGAIFSRDGKRLATAEVFPPGLALAEGGAGTEMRLWDAVTGQELHTFRGHTQPIGCIGFSPDGTRLASGSEDRNVKIWATATGKEVLTYRGHPMRVLHLMFSADGRRIASVSIDGTLKVWDSETGKDAR